MPPFISHCTKFDKIVSSDTNSGICYNVAEGKTYLMKHFMDLVTMRTRIVGLPFDLLLKCCDLRLFFIEENIFWPTTVGGIVNFLCRDIILVLVSGRRIDLLISTASVPVFFSMKLLPRKKDMV